MLHIPQSVVLIGTGKLAGHLACSFKQAGINIVQVYGRNNENAKKTARLTGADFTSDKLSIYKGAELYLLAVSDGAIEEVVSWLPGTKNIVAHTSGLVHMEVLVSKFENCGVLYPLQTFTEGRNLDYKSIPFLIESSNQHTETALIKLAEMVSSQVIKADSQYRSRIHLAAVYACNFTNYLYSVAQEIMEESGLSFDILKPLIIETASKATDLLPDAAQTGPAIRNDRFTIEAHLKLLDQMGKHQDVYALLTKRIIEKFNT